MNKKAKEKKIKQLLCTTIKLQGWGDFFFFRYTKNRGMTGGGEKT